MTVVVGISDKNMVMVDLDNMPFKRVRDLAMGACRHFRLDGFVVLKSSRNHYHVVFDKPIRCWSEVLRIVSWIAIMSGNPNVWKWVCMQAIKKACTLRISEKPTKSGIKPKPRVVYRYGCQLRKVNAYLKKREEVFKRGFHGNEKAFA